MDLKFMWFKACLGAVQLLKNETLKITYSNWDAQGHRRVATVQKGDAGKDSREKPKERLIAKIRELCAHLSRLTFLPMMCS